MGMNRAPSETWRGDAIWRRLIAGLKQGLLSVVGRNGNYCLQLSRFLTSREPPLSQPQKKSTQAYQRDASAGALPLREYRELVDRCAANRINQDIDNGTAVHARILITKLFEIAKKDVLLVSGKLTDTTEEGVEIYAYKELVEQAKRFLREPNANLTIVVLSGAIDRDEKNRFLTELTGAKDRLGMIKILLPNEGAIKDAPHFMVVDQTAYRYDADGAVAPKHDSVTAIANFGDVEGAKELAELFQDVENTLVAEGILKETKIVKALATSV
jgi:hypothetical protein